MYEDSSSEDEWCISRKRQVKDAHPGAKCWECGKRFSNLTSLMSHYESHNIEATCHTCEVTFRRLTSLSTHLDNVHSPPLCKRCLQSFSNVWEFNRHAEARCVSSAPFREAPSLIPAVVYQSPNCGGFSNEVATQQSSKSVLRDSASELRPQQRFEMKPERPETSENSVEYIVGEDDKDIDMDSDCERVDDSTSSESDDEEKTYSKPTAICAACGRGPFRSMKLHLLHCSGIRVKYQCSRCKELFLTEASLNEHYMPLYSCDVCGQVFSHENSYRQHQCPKGGKPPLVLFCSESMPQVCNICKYFFTSEKTLLNHVTQVHTSVVSTKVCIITNPSALTNKKLPPGVRGTAAQSVISRQAVVNQVIKGKPCVDQTYAGSLSSPSSLSTTSSHQGRPPAPICLASAAPVRSGKDGAQSQPFNRPLSRLPAPLFVPPDAPDRTPAAAAPDPVSTPMPTIVAMFQNDHLIKRMNKGWRTKAPYPCRQCGAILRQPSLIISHRYLHRGHRSHRCQCGRAFKHRLHLLRHCVQHAETINYICVSCGETFIGAKLLAEHMKGKSEKEFHSGRLRKRKVKRKCRVPFTCDCGQLFLRPSAYIWHQLQNRRKRKQSKKPLK